MFVTEGDYLFFQDCLGGAAIAHGVAIHAYAWMKNHVHLLATPATPQSLARMMQSVGRRYVQHFNRARQRTGTLWEGRYRSTLVDSERYFFACMHYIEWNAVRAGIVRRPEDYRWSSYRANALLCADALVTPHALYLQLAAEQVARAAAYRRLFVRPLSQEEMADIRRATNKAWVLGSDAFKARVEALTGRRAAPMCVRRSRFESCESLCSEESDPTAGRV
jgi:putative transposase